MRHITIIALSFALSEPTAAAEGKSDADLRDEARFYALDIVQSETCRRAGLDAPSDEEIRKSRAWPTSQYKSRVFQAAVAEEVRTLRPLLQSKRREDLLSTCGIHISEIERRTWTTQGLLPAAATIEAAQDALSKRDYVQAGQVATALMSKVNFTDGIVLLARSYAARATETPLLAYAAEHWFITANLRGRVDAQFDIGILRATTLADPEGAYKWLYALSVDGRALPEERQLGKEFANKVGERLSASARADVRSWVDAFWKPQNRKR